MSSLSYSDQQAIIRLCERHEEAHHLDFYYHRCVALGLRFIKYGGHGTLELEYKTHKYLFRGLLTPQKQWAYLVTEHIDTIRPADTAPEPIANSLQWRR